MLVPCSFRVQDSILSFLLAVESFPCSPHVHLVTGTSEKHTAGELPLGVYNYMMNRVYSCLAPRVSLRDPRHYKVLVKMNE